MSAEKFDESMDLVAGWLGARLSRLADRDLAGLGSRRSRKYWKSLERVYEAEEAGALMALRREGLVRRRDIG